MEPLEFTINRFRHQKSPSVSIYWSCEPCDPAGPTHHRSTVNQKGQWQRAEPLRLCRCKSTELKDHRHNAMLSNWNHRISVKPMETTKSKKIGLNLYGQKSNPKCKPANCKWWGGLGVGVVLHWTCTGLAGTHLASLGLTWAHLVSLGLTWTHLLSLRFTELTGSHLDSLDLTGSDLDPLGLTCICLDWLGPTWMRSVSLGLTWTCLLGLTRFHWAHQV